MAGMKKILLTIQILFLLTPFFCLAATPLEEGLNTAATTGTLVKPEETSADATAIINDRVVQIGQLFFGLLSFIFLVYAVLGGFYWMTAGGNEEKTKKGKEYLVNAIIGIVIISGAYVLAAYLINKLGSVT
jgi:hypothetical protein